MTLYLHIGMPKTGTTTIQAFLDINREKLAERGVVVPKSLGGQNHRKLTMYALEDTTVDHTRRMMGLLSAEQVAKFRIKFERKFAVEAASWPPESAVVMTGENMSQLRQPAELSRLRGLLQRHCDKPIKIVIYLRRQDLFYLSSYSQQIKAGRLTHWSDLTGDIKKRLYDYNKFLAPWASEFGKDNIIVRVFERTQMIKHDLLEDFMAILGQPGVEDLEIPETRNQSLDAQTVEYLRQMNQWYPRYVNDAVSIVRRQLVAAVEEISTGPRLRMARHSAVQFLSRFEQSNATIAREYLGREDGILFRDSPDDEAESPPSLTTEQAIEISAKLWARSQGALPPPKIGDASAAVVVDDDAE